MKWYAKNKRMLALLPAVLFIGLIVVYGLLMSFLESISGAYGWTIEHYLGIFKEERFVDSLSYSLYIAGISTLASLIIGLVVTKLIYHYLKNVESRMLVWIPMLFPHFVWGYMMVLLFSQTGWFSSLLLAGGLIQESSDFPILITDEKGIGIILTYIWKEVPFVVLLLLPVYLNMPKQLPMVVKTLGGNSWNVFRTVEWPWVFPVIVEAGIIVFAFVFSAFELPYLLGTTYPQMVPVLAYEWFYQGDWSKRPLAYVAMILITLIILMLALAASALMNKKRYYLSRGSSE
ncbi:Inner membrane ABC transporter permease protein YnjC [Bacillus sp. THAF10]|uniref:ABC transporter permease n=1 Tax=Bacillus sp. THAF10 TaxID=2587848 RepID=UPI001267B29E|nr:ABC transporter permease subunit [Bacillus sp. THAF10]QFT87877.1 Inner membrane ABC transporter permease protein YnjC [Bacillus sp. THAF10]